MLLDTPAQNFGVDMKNQGNIKLKTLQSRAENKSAKACTRKNICKPYILQWGLCLKYSNPGNFTAKYIDLKIHD